MRYKVNKRKQEFLQKVMVVHGKRYSYDKVAYQNSSTPVIIICKNHGEYLQRPRTHIEGSGCPICAREKNKLSIRDIITRSHTLHKHKYTYRADSIQSYRSKMSIMCPTHGTFQQSVQIHLQGRGCKRCSRDHRSLTKKAFIERAKTTHGDFYNYVGVQYINIHTKVNVICPLHGAFPVSPALHIQRTGCPRCRTSKAHKRIQQFLKKREISFIEEHRFDDCRNKYPLPFDFFLPAHNLLIEHDGEHHYRPVHFTSNKAQAQKQFLQTQIHDIIKNNYAVRKQIRLLRIPFTEKRIEEILLNSL